MQVIHRTPWIKRVCLLFCILNNPPSFLLGTCGVGNKGDIIAGSNDSEDGVLIASNPDPLAGCYTQTNGHKVHRHDMNSSNFCMSYTCSGSVEKNAACFSGDSTVEVLHNNNRTRSVEMKGLRVGDMVKTLCDKGNDLGYVECWTPVIGFLHRNETQPSFFYSWKTSRPAGVVRATGKHLVFQDSAFNVDIIDPQTVFVDTLKELSFLTRKTLLQNVDVKRHVGVYAPLTMDGTVLVGGVWFSCYGKHYFCFSFIFQRKYRHTSKRIFPCYQPDSCTITFLSMQRPRTHLCCLGCISL